MEQPAQQVAEASASLSVDVKEQTQEPEPQLATSPTEDKQSKKKKKKKKKNRRKSLERTQSEVEAQAKDTDKPEPEQEETPQAPVKDNQEEEEPAVALKPSIEETQEASIEEETVEVEQLHESSQALEASGDELGPPSLERQTSLDSLKATGTRAVGSLFSRFKVGRKKPPPSRTESTAKLELVNPSPVKTAVKRLEVPEEKNLDDLPMRTKRDFFGEGEQSIHVGAEKQKYDDFEKQRKAGEAAAAARQTPPSSTMSKEGLQAHVDANKRTPEAPIVEEDSKKTVQSDNKALNESADAELETEVSSEVNVSAVTQTVSEETSKPDDPAPSSATVDISGSSKVVVESLHEEVSTTLETSADVQDTIAKEDDDSVTMPVSAIDETTEVEQPSLHTSQPVSLELDLDPDLKNYVTDSAHSDIEEAAGEDAEFQSNEAATESTVTDSVEAVASTNSQIEEAELLSVKVTSPTSELPAEAVAPAKPEIMSPVKSLASRFEGKREQSLDSLKFRTVREFFTAERSIRVSAEKQKFEAQAQQQKLKAKAEEEATSKYKTGAGSRSPDKDSVMVSASSELKAAVSVDAVVDEPVNLPVLSSTEPVDFSTPDAAVGRKKSSFDEGYASANSPGKISDDAPEALAPVKSIASRFEGKHEQSLDSLKFRTVREFFPEERSVRVGSEKKKFEAQAQQGNSLDTLKFRTVREFFPEDSKRSIHVGAERAKYEALSKHQEEVAKSAEQFKLKHAAPVPSLAALKHDSFKMSSNVEGINKVSTSSLDESPVEFSTTPAASGPAQKDEVVMTESAETSVSTKAAVDEAIAEVKDSSTANATSAGTHERSNLHLISTEDETSCKEDTLVQTNQLEDTKNIAAVEPVVVSNQEVVDPIEGSNGLDIETSEENQEPVESFKKKFKPQEQAEKEGEMEAQGVEPQNKLKGEQVVVPESKLKVEQNVEAVQEAELTAVDVHNGVEELDLSEPAMVKLVKLAADIPSDIVHISEETTIKIVQADDNQEPIEVIEDKAEQEVTVDRFVDLDLDEPAAQVESVGALVVGDIELVADNNLLDIHQSVKDQRVVNEADAEVAEGSSGGENGLVELDLGDPVVTKSKVDSGKQANSKSRPMLTTERSFVMEDDHTIETEDTVVVVERPMTDGEDEFEPLSSTTQAAHELFAGITPSKSKKEASSSKTSATKSSHASKTSLKLTRKVSAGSSGSLKSPPAKTTVPVPMERESITAPTASYMAKKAAEPEESHKKASSQLQKRDSAAKLKGQVSEIGFVKPPPAAPTVPVPMKRASITAPTASWQARNVPDHAGKTNEFHPATKTHTKPKGVVSSTGFVKPLPPPPTVPVAPKRASIMAPTASYMAKKAAEHTEEVDTAALSAPGRKKRYSNVKSKVLDGIQSGSVLAYTRKTITKEEFIAAERRKSFGSAGVRSVLDVVDRRASLAARVTIDGPPEPFFRSAVSRKKLNSTVPRYMNYENSAGYSERAQQQYERRKRLEEENAAKSEKRQKELRMFFAEQQQKALKFSADEVRRGLEAHEFAKLAKESEIAAQKALRKDKQHTRSSRTSHRASSATSSAGASSSNGVPSRASKKSSVSSVEQKVVAPLIAGSPAAWTEIVVESVAVEKTFVESSVPAAKGISHDEVAGAAVDDTAVEVVHADEQAVPAVDEDPALEHVAKKIDFDEASCDSDEKDVSN